MQKEFAFVPNPEEDDLRQIPEIVLKRKMSRTIRFIDAGSSITN